MTKRILLVDGDAKSRKVLSKILSEDGYEIVEGLSGQKALALARDENPDMVLMDVELPGLSGREVCRILKGNEDFACPPIILITPKEDVQLVAEKPELGADDFLTKPVHPLELQARVRSMLRLKKLQDDLIRSNERLQTVNERLHALSSLDSLTGLHNRLSFEQRMRYEFQRTERYGTPLSMLMCDLDHFKRINDTLGHPFGDRVLKAVADCLVDCVRVVDLVARWGGEEMVVTLPECNVANAMIVAERIRKKVEALEVSADGQKAGITISIGASQYPDSRVRSVDEMLDLADKALYLAKSQGRNQACYIPPVSDPKEK